MQCEFLGHAGFIITQGAIRVACDPWLSPLGAFHASWFQLPCNHRLWERDYRTLTAVVITDAGKDRLDAGFLSAKLSPETPILIPQQTSGAIRQAVRKACANPIIEIKPGTDHTVGGGLRVFFSSDEADAGPAHAVTFRTLEAALVNLSTARLTLKQRDVLKVRLGGRIDALLVSCAAPSWNPLCYRHSDERMAAFSMVKRVEKLEYAYQALFHLTPRVGIPYGGPPVFLEESLSRFNDDRGGKGLVPDQLRARDWLLQRGYGRRMEIPLPGDRLNLLSGESEPDPVIREEFSFEKKDAALKSYAERIRPAITAYLKTVPRPAQDLFEPFRDDVRRLAATAPDALLVETKFEIRFVVDSLHGGDYLVRCDAGELTAERTGDRAAPCTVSMDALWLHQILSHTLSWDDFFQTMRFSVEQDPEAEEDHLAAWRAVVASEQSATKAAPPAPTEKPAHA